MKVDMNTSGNQAVKLDPVEELAEQPSGSGRRSPGAMLSAQRETLELSIQQVADQLNLTMHFVKALEADSYDKLPGDVFVRGYIRAYSNLLRLDPVQVLAIFDEFTSQKIALKEEAIKRRRRRRQDKNRPWIIFSGFAFVAVALGLWYLNPAAPVAVDSTASDTAGTADLSVLGAAPLPTPASSASVAVVSVNSSSQTQETQRESPNAVQLTAVSAEDLLSAQTETHQWSGSDELTLELSADCWVEVEHQGGEESYRNQISAGDTLVIRGTAPFSILLGNASNVALTFNGRSMDISSNVRADNTARLSIGM